MEVTTVSRFWCVRDARSQNAHLVLCVVSQAVSGVEYGQPVGLALQEMVSTKWESVHGSGLVTVQPIFQGLHNASYITF